MTVLWNKHRFSGGLLILDTTNTVVLRGDPARSFDRFEDVSEIGRFADAASIFRSAELGGRRLSFEPSDTVVRRVVGLREAADRLFRATALSGQVQARRLAEVLGASASCLEGSDESIGGPDAPFGDPSRPIGFEVALAVSALSLLSGDNRRNVRICQNCNWLFLDRSRNASRLWCDMSVCGNRQKAKRHYERLKSAQREIGYAQNVDP